MFGRQEKRFSLGLADSEINLLNTLAGESCLVSNTMLEVLFLAEMYQAITDGNYTPLLDKDGATPTHSPAVATQGCRLNPTTKSQTLPEMLPVFDLQGLRKVPETINRLYEENLIVLQGGSFYPR